MVAEHQQCTSSWAKQSISYGTAAPGAISDGAVKAVCSFIPALGLFHALWLPASLREEDAHRARWPGGERAPEPPPARNPSPDAGKLLQRPCVLAGKASGD